MESLKICRLCLQTTPKHLELFSEVEDELRISEIVQKYLWFDLQPDDQFSNLICTQCWDVLKQFHLFCVRIQQAHKGLLAECQTSSTKVDDNLVNVKRENVENVNEFFEQVYIIDHDVDDVGADADANDESFKEENSDEEKHSIKRSSLDEDKKLLCRRVTRPTNRRHNVLLKKKLVKRGRKNKEEKVEVMKQLDQEEIDRKEKTIHEFFKMECELCRAQTENIRKLSQHYRHEHGLRQGYIQCCKRKWYGRNQMYDHAVMHINSKLFVCGICNENFDNDRMMKVHMFYHEGEDKKFTCDICTKKYLSKMHLKIHMRRMHCSEEDRNHKCGKCGKGFVTKKLLEVHVLGVHEAAFARICYICGKVLKGKNQCAIHMASVHATDNSEKCQCSICNSWFTNRRCLKRHIQRAHQDKPSACNVCGKVALNRDALKSHIRYAHNDKKYQCKLCQKFYKSQLSLKEHMASHTGNTLYVCTYCPKTFNFNANMYSHRKRSHPEEWKRDKDKKVELK